VEDISWFQPDGSEMSEEHWNQDFAKSMAVFLNGQGIRSVGPKGEQVTDDSFYIIFNAHHEPLEFKLPARRYGTNWIKVIDTSSSIIADDTGTYSARESITAESRSIVVLRKPK
jgi:isoamylase